MTSASETCYGWDLSGWGRHGQKMLVGVSTEVRAAFRGSILHLTPRVSTIHFLSTMMLPLRKEDKRQLVQR